MMKKQAGVALAMLALAGVAASAAAADSTGPVQQRAQALRNAALREAGRPVPGRHAASAALDQQAPVLRSFSVKVPANIAAPQAQVVIDLKVSDDLSGVYDVVFNLVGPHGQTLVVAGSQLLPATKVEARAAVDVSDYTEPGTWTVFSAFVRDYAGNFGIYGADELAGLGNSTVTLVSKRPGHADITPPTVVSGVLRTPTVSSSAIMPGTASAGGVLAADFIVTDDSSGVEFVGTTWCDKLSGTCFGMGAINTLFKDSTNLALTILSEYTASSPPQGTYTLSVVSVQDHAGNYRYLTGIEFGGTTDFSALMPQGHTITVTP
jgi:hypothetical protein